MMKEHINLTNNPTLMNFYKTKIFNKMMTLSMMMEKHGMIEIKYSISALYSYIFELVCEKYLLFTVS